MAWLKVRYSPGFQEDLTSWTLVVDTHGRVHQQIDVRRFAPREERVEAHEWALSDRALSEVRDRLNSLDADSVRAAATEFVIDDAEHIEVTWQSEAGSHWFVAPLEWWHHQALRGRAQPSVVLQAVALWRVLASLSRHAARRA